MRRPMPVNKAEAADFAARVRGDHPDEQSYKRYVLGQLRCARMRVQLMIVEIDGIGQALKASAIDADRALIDLHAVGLLDFMQPSEPPFERLVEDEAKVPEKQPG